MPNKLRFYAGKLFRNRDVLFLFVEPFSFVHPYFRLRYRGSIFILPSGISQTFPSKRAVFHRYPAAFSVQPPFLLLYSIITIMLNRVWNAEENGYFGAQPVSFWEKVSFRALGSRVRLSMVRSSVYGRFKESPRLFCFEHKQPRASKRMSVLYEHQPTGITTPDP